VKKQKLTSAETEKALNVVNPVKTPKALCCEGLEYLVREGLVQKPLIQFNGRDMKPMEPVFYMVVRQGRSKRDPNNVFLAYCPICGAKL